MNQLLISIDDVRKYRQLGKQLNIENFQGRVREIQENELTELFGEPLSYDFFDYFDNDWNNQAGTFTRVSDTQFKVLATDLTSWTSDYGLKINSEVFVIVKTAVLDGSDTLITIEGYILPDSITSLEYKDENDYIKLLNGTNYVKDSDTLKFNGIRPFMIWKFLAIYLTDGDIKHSDTGNFSITSPNFMQPTSGEKKQAISGYLQNSIREENRISDFLNENNTLYPLWETKNAEQNINNLDFFVI